MYCDRIPKGILFGPNRSSYSTLTIASTGVITYASPIWVPLSTTACNGVAVQPFVDTSGNYTFNGALVLRLQLKQGYSTESDDGWIFVPTLGGETLLPLCCQVWAISLYALGTDQNKNCSVTIF